MTTSTVNTQECAIAHNGPMTTFSLTMKDGRELYLCRDDLPRLAKGDLSFDDGRTPLAIDEDQRNQLAEQAEKLMAQIEKGLFFVDLAGYSRHFEAHPDAYGSLDDKDLGRYFLCEGRPFVLLGAIPRARKYKLAAKNLLDGSVWRFSVEYIERVLGKDVTAA